MSEPRIVRSEPLSRAGFAPFGAIVSADRDDVAAKAANLGTAARCDFLVDLVNHRPGARLNVASFRCAPWVARPLVLDRLERHVASTQLFVPMTPAPYLVVVAGGGDEPDLASLRAFQVEGARGIAYAPGTWHHPMIALSSPIDFTCFVYEDGSPLDCETAPLAPFRIELDGD